jgi:hypothetical protein
MSPRDQAERIWNAAWDAALQTERQRALLESGEAFACDPREWCFDMWASRNGLSPRSPVLVPTATGFKEMVWSEDRGTYEERTPP